MKLEDLKGLKNKATLTFDHLKLLEDGHIELYFNKPESFTFRAGEHGVFTNPNQKKGRNWRPLSVASSPSENQVILGTKTRSKVSAYKSGLLSLKKGDPLKVRGPFGPFVEQKNGHPHLFIGLGVGITPIRSILKDQTSLKDSTLLYSSSQVFMFDDDFKTLEKEGLSYLKVSSREHLNQRLDSLLKDPKKINVYLSGPAKAVSALKKALKQKGVLKKHIITDVFFGY
jgi:ferredoxin-NADP reductase